MKQMTIAKQIIENNEEKLSGYAEQWLAMERKKIELLFKQAKLCDEFYAFCQNEFVNIGKKKIAKASLKVIG